MDKLSRREREKKTRRDAILCAAAKIFAQKGYHGATLEEIAEEAEFSKGALYIYFKNKEDLFICTFQNGIEKLSTKIMQATIDTVDLKEELQEVITALLSFVEDNKNFFKLLFEQRVYKEEKIDDELEESKLKIINLLNKFIQNCQNSGLVTLKYSVGELSGILFGIFAGTIWNWMYENSTESLVEKSNIIMEIFWNGAGTHDN